MQRERTVHHVQMTEGKRNIIRQLLEAYDIESAKDIQDALKDLLGSVIFRISSFNVFISITIVSL